MADALSKRVLKALGLRIRDLRRAQGLSQEDLADKCGVHRTFMGTVERGEGKSRADEAYYVLQGTLVENTTDAAKKISSRSVDVLLRSFPQDLAPPPPTERK